MVFSARTVRSLTAVAALSVLAVVTAGAEQPGRMAQEAACTAQADWGVAPSRLTLLARGFNLTGWFDRVPAQPPSMPVLASLHARGFTHVRLPITAESRNGPLRFTASTLSHKSSLTSTSDG